MKELKEWELSDKNNNVTAIDDMKSYIQPTISIDPKCILLQCGTNDLRQNTSAVETVQNREF